MLYKLSSKKWVILCFVGLYVTSMTTILNMWQTLFLACSFRSERDHPTPIQRSVAWRDGSWALHKCWCPADYQRWHLSLHEAPAQQERGCLPASSPAPVQGRHWEFRLSALPAVTPRSGPLQKSLACCLLHQRPGEKTALEEFIQQHRPWDGPGQRGLSSPCMACFAVFPQLFFYLRWKAVF